MSIEASEIITSMLRTLTSDMIALHNQHINDMQALIARIEIRMLEEFDTINRRLTALEQYHERSSQP